MSGEEKSLLEHLEDLGNCLKRIIICIAVSFIAVLSVPASPEAINNLASIEYLRYTLVGTVLAKIRQDFYYVAPNMELIGFTFMAPAEVFLASSVMLAIAVASPFIAYELYKFVNPALYSHERRLLISHVIAFTGLFTLGVVFGYFILAPITLRILLIFPHILGAEYVFSITSFYQLILAVVVISGFLFTIPLILIVAIELGLVETSYLTKNRRYIYGATLIILALITPDPTIVSDFILFVPLFIFFELAIYIGKRIEKKRKSNAMA